MSDKKCVGKCISTNEKTIHPFNLRIIENLKNNNICPTKNYYDKKGVFIYNLAVLKSCRGNGLGKSLVRVLMNHFKKVGVEYFHVQIDEDNEGSNKIFKGQGFTARKNLMADDNNKFNVLTYFV